MKKMSIVTLDGPAGVGKSTLAKAVAAALGWAYLDTGAMFRTLALRLGPGVEKLPKAELFARCMGFSFELSGSGGDTKLLCNGVAPGAEIRSEQVAQQASRLAALTTVRDYLKEAQRILGEAAPLVAEGRDMGTEVFPGALHKFFLDATPEVRAERRCLELKARGENADVEAVAALIRQRDDMDRTRIVAPLRPAPDAEIIDTSGKNVEEVLAEILAAIRAREAEPDSVRAARFSHLAEDGSVTMVDVGAKPATERMALVRAVVEISPRTLELLRQKALPKGDVLVTAKLAGILAAKRTAELIPLCHPVPLTSVDLRFAVHEDPPAIHIEAEARTCDRTGVEMEALIAAQCAAATIYDMCKAVQRDIVIRDVRLVYKSGGRSGVFDVRDAQ